MLTITTIIVEEYSFLRKEENYFSKSGGIADVDTLQPFKVWEFEVIEPSSELSPYQQ